jgi:hypothetical protein
MLAATLIGVVFTPLFYWLVMTFLTRGRKGAAPGAQAGAQRPAGVDGAERPTGERAA